MKKEQRRVYVEFTKIGLPSLAEGFDGETGFTCLCQFCKYAKWFGNNCEDMYVECHHPLNRQGRTLYFEESPGSFSEQDCWGFRSAYPLAVVADYIGQRLEGQKVALPQAAGYREGDGGE